MARSGCKSKGGFDFEGGLCSTFQNETSSHQNTPDSEWLCQPGKELVSKRGIAGSNRQVGGGKSGCPVIPILLQLVVSSTQTQQQMETHFGSQSIKTFT